MIQFGPNSKNKYPAFSRENNNTLTQQQRHEKTKEKTQKTIPPTTSPMKPRDKALGSFSTQCNVGTVTSKHTIVESRGERREGEETVRQKGEDMGFARKTR